MFEWALAWCSFKRCILFSRSGAVSQNMPFKGADNDAETLAEREAEYNQLKLSLHLAQADRQHYIEEMQTAMGKMK